MNQSKIKPKRFWKGWYKAGAVKQQQLQGNDLVIDSICDSFSGISAGYSVVSLGKRVVNSGPGWSVEAPVYTFVVPVTKKYELGLKLKKVPGNAIPVKVFFERW